MQRIRALYVQAAPFGSVEMKFARDEVCNWPSANQYSIYSSQIPSAHSVDMTGFFGRLCTR